MFAHGKDKFYYNCGRRNPGKVISASLDGNISTEEQCGDFSDEGGA